MNAITEKEFVKILKGFKGSEIYIKTEGKICSRSTIHKLDFQLQYDILRIKDKISSNYFNINLNMVYQLKTSKDKNVLKLYTDEDIVITIIY